MADITSNKNSLRSRIVTDEKVPPADGMYPEPSSEPMDTVAQRLSSLKRQTALVNDPIQERGVQQMEEEAKDLYNSQANRTEWLSLAEKIGNSLVRLNAANKGLKEGVDLSGVNLGPGTDWNGQMDRYGRDYDRTLKQAVQKRDQNRQTGLDTQKQYDHDYEDQFAGGKAEFENEKNKYNQKTDSFQQDRKDAASHVRRMEEIGSQEGRADRRASDADTRAAKREQDKYDDFVRRERMKDVVGQESDAEKQLQARATLINQLEREGDFSAKGKERLQQKYGQIAAQAGMDLDATITSLEAEDHALPGWLGGRSNKDDKTAKTTILSGKLAESKNLLDQIRLKKKELIESGGGTGGVKQINKPQQPAPDKQPGTEDSKSPPAGQAKEPTEDQVSKYVKMYPKVTPEQAKEILRKRLNG